MAGIKSIISSRDTDGTIDNDDIWLIKQLDACLENPKHHSSKDSTGTFYASSLGNPCDRFLFLHYNTYFNFLHTKSN